MFCSTIAMKEILILKKKHVLFCNENSVQQHTNSYNNISKLKYYCGYISERFAGPRSIVFSSFVDSLCERDDILFNIVCCNFIYDIFFFREMFTKRLLQIKRNIISDLYIGYLSVQLYFKIKNKCIQ